jgi:hypothetical protein
MKPAIDRLLEIGTTSLGPQHVTALASLQTKGITRDLWELLSQRNGFYAFESALLVRPLASSKSPLRVTEWNRPTLWRNAYEADFGEALFFAEDILGMQFCITKNGVSSFDPETGTFEPIAKNIEEWASWILEDYRVRTGWPLAREWQLRYGQIERRAAITSKGSVCTRWSVRR